MDTIDNNVMQAAAEAVIQASQSDREIYTVVVTLNGAHGGADVILSWYDGDSHQSTSVEVH